MQNVRKGTVIVRWFRIFWSGAVTKSVSRRPNLRFVDFYAYMTSENVQISIKARKTEGWEGGCESRWVHSIDATNRSKKLSESQQNAPDESYFVLWYSGGASWVLFLLFHRNDWRTCIIYIQKSPLFLYFWRKLSVGNVVCISEMSFGGCGDHIARWSANFRIRFYYQISTKWFTQPKIVFLQDE